jgi:hypothetical protein
MMLSGGQSVIVWFAMYLRIKLNTIASLGLSGFLGVHDEY